METDRELLELAAKAAGIVIQRNRLDDPLNRDFLVVGSARNLDERLGPWNPLAVDGDALRLAVALDIAISPSGTYAATRRAIVRCAAEIGRTM